MMIQQAPDLRKFFQRKSFPGVEVTQSPFVIMNGELYAVVGQHIILSSPLYTYYDVLDEDGVPASVDIAEEVYSYVAMTQITTFMSKLKAQLIEPIEEQKKTRQIEEIDEDLGEQIRLKYMLKHDVNILELEEDNSKIQFLFEQVESANELLLEMNTWTESNLQEFQRAWKAFWKVYQGRMSKLFQFYDYCKNFEIIQDVVNGTQLDHIYREAKAMYEVFTNGIPEDTPFIKDVNDFITLMAQLGLDSYHANKNNMFKPIGTLLEYILQTAYKMMLWITIPIFTLRFLLNNVSLLSLGSVVLITFGCYAGDLLVRSYLQSAGQKHLKKQRTNAIINQPIVQSTYKEVYAGLQQRRQAKKVEVQNREVYKVRVTRPRPGYGFIFIGLVITGFGFIVQEATDDSQYLPHYIVIGSTVAFIGIILIIILRGTLYLEPNRFKFKIMRFVPEAIINIQMTRSGSKIYVRVFGIHQYTLNVPKGHRKQAKADIIKWCEENNVSYSEMKISKIEVTLLIIVLSLLTIIFTFTFIN